MSINVTIDGTKYSGVEQVNVGGKSLMLESEAVAPSGDSAVVGVRHEVSVTPTGNTYTVEFPCSVIPENYLLKVYAENPTGLAANRLVSASILRDKDTCADGTPYGVKVVTSTTDASVINNGACPNIPVFDGAKMTWNVSGYYDANMPYKMILIDLTTGRL